MGPRWARDHADDKKPTLAAALEKAFDPMDDSAAIGLDQATGANAAAWLPPGLAYGNGVTGEQADLREANGAPIEIDPQEIRDEAAEDGGASSDLPAS